MAGAVLASSSLLHIPGSRSSTPVLRPRRASMQYFAAPPPRRSSTTLRVSSTSHDSAASAPEVVGMAGAADVVKAFYDGINRRDLAHVEELIAEDCVYEDLVFSLSFNGRKEIMELFEKFTAYISTDLQLIIADITNGDSHCVGVTWHLEWKGKPLRNSKGCSFYRLVERDQKRQIVYGRDVVEPTIKSGKAVLVVIKGVTWLLQRFPHLADL